jgi:hypothetical protein
MYEFLLSTVKGEFMNERIGISWENSGKNARKVVRKRSTHKGVLGILSLIFLLNSSPEKYEFAGIRG